MVHALDTTCIYEDEDTKQVHSYRLVMPYSQMNGPFADVSFLWDDHEHVTRFQDDFGSGYCVLEPLQKVLDGWMHYLEQQDGFKPISFSSQ